MRWNDAMDRILETLTAEAREDLVGVWLVLRWGRRVFPQLDPKNTRAVTLGIIERGLKSGAVRAGSFVEVPAAAFETWSLDAIGSLERIDQRWQALARDPDIGDNLWLIGSDVEYVVTARR